MKVNDLIVARTNRACTIEELDHLQHRLKNVASPRKRQLKAILNVFVLWGCLLLGMLLLSGVLSYLSIHSEIISSLLALSGLREIAIASTATYALFSTYRWLQKWDNPYPNILRDINGAEVIEETFQVQDLCRFKEPELGGFIYFLKVSDQHVFVIYDYQSQGDVAANLMPIQNRLILSRAPHSGVYLNHRFSGKNLLPSSTQPLSISPEKWPLPDTWFPYPWSELTARLAR